MTGERRDGNGKVNDFVEYNGFCCLVGGIVLLEEVDG